MTETATADAGILDLLEEAEWTENRQGRGEEISPYLPAVQKSWAERAEGAKQGKAFAFTINVGKGDPTEQDKMLTKHVNLLRKAGRQVEGDPVSVKVQAGDVNRKSGDVRITFVTREKISRPGAGNATAPATAA